MHNLIKHYKNIIFENFNRQILIKTLQHKVLQHLKQGVFY